MRSTKYNEKGSRNVALHLFVVGSDVRIACNVNASVVGTVDDVSQPAVGLGVEGLAYIVCRDSLESDTEDLKLLACGDLFHSQTKFLRLVYSVRTDDDSVGLHYLADIIRGVVVEVAVCDEDNVSVVSSVLDVIRIGVYELSIFNADTAVFVYGYEIKHSEISLSVFFYNYSIDRRG